MSKHKLKLSNRYHLHSLLKMLQPNNQQLTPNLKILLIQPCLPFKDGLHKMLGV